jgi:hypothetical protein
VWSSDAVAIRKLSGLKTAELIAALWRKAFVCARLAKESQSFAVLSSDAVKILDPSGLKIAEHTAPL